LFTNFHQSLLLAYFLVDTVYKARYRTMSKVTVSKSLMDGSKTNMSVIQHGNSLY